MTSNYVFLLNTNKTPLTPIHPKQARVLLSKKQAAVFKHQPFTIILKKELKTPLPIIPLQINIVPGSKFTGIALVSCTKEKEVTVYWGAELTHRGLFIKKNLDQRRAIRRSRRSRKTRYRAARFFNRKKPIGWLAPSIEHRVLTTMTWVKRLMRLAPVKAIAHQLHKFDMQKMMNPEIQGVEYQQGELFGYEVKEYLLEKWGRNCAYCGAKDTKLNIDHINPKALGGTDRVSNLCIACVKCNQKKGKLPVETFLKNKPDLLKKVLTKAKAPLKDAAAVNITRWKMFNELKALRLPVQVFTGARARYNRRCFKLDKSHFNDAVCLGDIKALRFFAERPIYIKALGWGDRHLCRVDKYGFPRSKPRQKHKIGWETGDLGKFTKTTGKNKGKYIGRIVVSSKDRLEINQPVRVSGKVKEFVKLQARDGYSYSYTKPK